MSDADAVAKQFTEYYYNTFDRDRSHLIPLYRDASMLTFEGSQIQGAGSIIAKLASLPFTKVQHKVMTIDTQPSVHPGALIVSVTGLLLVDDESNPLNFSQVFQLIAEGGTYYVYNDIFRLNYGV